MHARANRWQTFWRVTLPEIRWGLLYGLTLTLARALGEFGAVLIAGGNYSGVGGTQTATLFIYDKLQVLELTPALTHQDRVEAYTMALVLAVISFIILYVIETVRRRIEVEPK